METTLTLDAKPKTDAEYEAAIDQMFVQMRQMQAVIAEKQRHIEKLHVQTQEKMAKLESVLARLEAS